MRATYTIYICLSVLFLLLFAKGLFLVRLALPERGDIPSRDQPPLKAIILLVDGMRADMIDKMEIYHRLNTEHPEQTITFLFHSDAPTATMLRLAAINTGNIPPFIDFAKNFQAMQLAEDSVIWQLKHNNKSMVFAGDDTWTQLFPDSFIREYPRDSFNVNDLNTVDDAVIECFNDNIGKRDWDVLIGHVLGLDHVGHTFEKNKNLIDVKLKQYDTLLTSMYDQMEPNTVLIMLGDHGMRPLGNHGGGTDAETHSILMASIKSDDKYFFRNFSAHLRDPSNLTDRSYQFVQDSVEFHSDIVEKQHYLRKVSQIDFVPTLANLLGVPLPYSSIGMIIPEFMVLTNESHLCDRVFDQCNRSLTQVMTYITKIQENEHLFPQALFDEWKSVQSSLSGECTMALSREALSLQNEIQQYARIAWNEQDTPLILISALGYLLTLILAILLMRSFQIHVKFSELVREHVSERVSLDSSNDHQKSSLQLILTITLIATLCFLATNVYYTICLLAVIATAYQIGRIQGSTPSLYNWRIFTVSSSEALSIVFLLKTIIDRAWIQLSMYYLIVEDDSLFSVFCWNLIQFKVVEVIRHRSAMRGRVVQDVLLPATILLAMLIAQQYDPSYSRDFMKKSYKIKSLDGYLFHPLLIGVLPMCVLQYFLRKLFLTIDTIYQNKSSVLQFLAHASLGLTSLFHVLRDTFDLSHTQFFLIYFPRIIYMLAIISIFVLLISRPKQYRIHLAINVFILSILVTGQSSQMLACLWISIVYLLWLSLKDFQVEGLPYFYTGMIGVLSSQFWFKLGNRCEFSALNLDGAYLGFQEFNYYITGTLLIFSLLNYFLVGLLFLPFICDVQIEYTNRKAKVNKLATQIVNKQDYHCAAKFMYVTPYLVQAVIVGINCFFNFYNVMLQDKFLPKLIFDMGAYIPIGLLSLI